MERTSNLRPDRHQRRRNSYIIAMEADITIIELAEINRRQSIKVGSNPETKKTAHTESHESKEESEGSSPKKTHRNTIKMPSSTSISSSMQEIETLDVHFLHRHTSMNKSSASECSCQNDTSPLHRNSFSTFSIKRNDSAFSLSTCQSVLASSSARNSANTLNNLHMNRSNRDNILETNERRNSDQTYVRSYRNNQRRLSDQSFVKFNNFPGEEKSLRQSLPRPPLSLTKNSDSHSHDNWKSAKDRQRSLTRRDSETSIKSSCRGSISPITPKIMRRRFSEQLILEGGLRSEGEFEDLIEEDAGDSFTAINARKKVTLKRHYYPEGNWGFVVVVAALIVQILCHGLQLGSGVLINPITVKFHTTSDNIVDRLIKELPQSIAQVDIQ